MRGDPFTAHPGYAWYCSNRFSWTPLFTIPTTTIARQVEDPPDDHHQICLSVGAGSRPHISFSRLVATYMGNTGDDKISSLYKYFLFNKKSGTKELINRQKYIIQQQPIIRTYILAERNLPARHLSGPLESVHFATNVS